MHRVTFTAWDNSDTHVLFDRIGYPLDLSLLGDKLPFDGQVSCHLDLVQDTTSVLLVERKLFMYYAIYKLETWW